MKYLVLLVVLVVAIGLWRNGLVVVAGNIAHGFLHCRIKIGVLVVTPTSRYVN